MRQAVIVASSRTPLAKSHRGSFNMTRPDDLAAHAIRHVLGKAPGLDPAGGRRGDPRLRPAARRRPATTSRASRRCAPACRVTTAGVTVNRYCNSGLQAIVQAAHMVMHEGVDAAIGGGVESITMMERDNSPNPWLVEHLPGALHGHGRDRRSRRQALRHHPRGAGRVRARQPAAHGARAGRTDSSRASSRRCRCGAPCSTRRPASVGEEDALRRSRRVQSAGHDARRACEAAAGLRHDERPRQRHRRQFVAAVRRRVGDARDVERTRQRRSGVAAAARFSAATPSPAASPTKWASARCSPCRSCCKKHGLRVDDIDVWELNEAFASQVVYCRDRLGMPMDRLNLNGGSIAIGHPFGMTGSRLVGTIDERDDSAARHATASSRCASAAARGRRRCSNACETCVSGLKTRRHVLQGG